MLSLFYKCSMHTADGKTPTMYVFAPECPGEIYPLFRAISLTKALQVLTEVRDAPRTLKIAAPMAIASVTLLYVLANIAFFAAMSKQQIADSKVIVAAAFFENVS